MSLIPYSPGSGEEGGYNRIESPFFWMTRNFTWVWKFQQVDPGGFPLRARALIDDQPATDWVVSRRNSAGVPTGIYDFVCVDVPNGHHKFGAEFEGTTRPVLEKPFVVNDTGAPLPEQKPWSTITHFEETWGRFAQGSLRVDYPGSIPMPVVFPLKAREHPPAGGVLLGKDKFKIRKITDNISARLLRNFVDLPTGDVAIEGDQKYFHTSAINGGRKPPIVTTRDGPRGHGSLGYVYKFIIRRGGKVAYFMETNGRFGIIVLEDITTVPEPGADMSLNVMPKKQGYIATMAGWRLKPGELKQHGGTITAENYMYPLLKTAHRARYDSKWEMAGDWSKVTGPHTFFEPWGFSIARRKPDGSVDTRDGLEAWVMDTLHHRALYVNMWTGHAAFYRPAQFPPVGYVSPPDPTGKVEIANFAGSLDGNLTGEWNSPWDSDIGPDERLYVSMFEGNSICSMKLDGTDFRVEVKCVLQPTNAELGVSERRLSWGYLDSTLRGEILSTNITYAEDIAPGALTIHGFAVPGLPAEPASRVVGGVDTPYTQAQRIALRLPKWAAAINTLTSQTHVEAIVEGTAVRLRLVDFGARQGIALFSTNVTHTGFTPKITKSYVRDGLPGVATCCRPQGIKFNSKGKLLITEMYTYAIREFDPVTKMLRTIQTFPRLFRGSASASTNEISLAVDVEGDRGPVDGIYVSAWAGDFCWLPDSTGKYVFKGQWAWTSGADLANGPQNLCFAPEYAWGGPGIGDGKLIYSGNAAGWQCWECTRRLPTDMVYDDAKYDRAIAAYRDASKMYIAHGASGQNRLGFPSFEEIGSWEDARIKNYAKLWGIPEDRLDDFLYMIRWETQDQDYSTAPPVDVTPPAAPLHDLTVVSITDI